MKFRAIIYLLTVLPLCCSGLAGDGHIGWAAVSSLGQNGTTGLTVNGSVQVSQSAPATGYLTNRLSGSALTLTWPAGHGWRLVSQANCLSTNGWGTASGGGRQQLNCDCPS